jgi:hypothetical protein
MRLSLHAEYLLGYLAGARELQSEDVVPFAMISPGDTSQQARALVKSLALGVSDGRGGRSVRDASDVRVRVLAMIARENLQKVNKTSHGSAAHAANDDLPAPEVEIINALEQGIDP